MNSADKAAYHRRRASRELRLGMTAICPAAARAHLKLAALHMAAAGKVKPGRGRASHEPEDTPA